MPGWPRRAELEKPGSLAEHGACLLLHGLGQLGQQPGKAFAVHAFIAAQGADLRIAVEGLARELGAVPEGQQDVLLRQELLLEEGRLASGRARDVRQLQHGLGRGRAQRVEEAEGMVFLLVVAGREGIGMAGKAVDEVEGAVEDLGMVEHAFEIGRAAPALSGAAEQLQQNVDRKADEKKDSYAHRRLRTGLLEIETNFVFLLKIFDNLDIKYRI